MRLKLGYLLTWLLAICKLFGTIAGQAIDLNSENIYDILHNNDLVLILFYAETCGFSMNFMPIFDAAARQLRLAFSEDGKLTLGKVNCLANPILESRFNVGKYPTVKIVRYGQVAHREYRGHRSLEAIIQFAHQELRDPIHEFYSMNDLQALPNQEYMILGYFEHRELLEYEVYRKTSLALRDHCNFHVSFGKAAKLLNPSGGNRITFIRNLNHEDGIKNKDYEGNMTGFSEMLNWTRRICEPLVRELTFDNAEEISEEGRPFVVLFHSKTDVKSLHEFEKVIETELMDELSNVNFLTADGKRFHHSLFHLEKSEEDLPIIAIDSFIHMYLFPNYTDIHTPGKLKEFIRSLFSGKLHIAYHLLEDPGEAVGNNNQQETEQDDQFSKVEELGEETIQVSTTPKPVNKSKFKELLPSKKRYTFARDEL